MKTKAALNRIGIRISYVMLCLLILVLTSCLSSTGAAGTTIVYKSPAGGQGTLNLADTGPITLDPAVAAESSSAAYIVQIFSGLLKYDENLQISGDIAQSWDKSSDGMTFTFHLRQDAKFQDGTMVKASDFKYSWERALNPATGSQTASTYLNDIVGAADILDGKTKQLSGVKVLDNHTLQVTIDAPKAYFIDKMAYPTAFVVEKTNVESGSNWWQHPIGTGPFRLKQWQTDRLVVLERNPDYYGEKAKLNQVVYQLYNGNPMQLYQEGSIDVSPVPSVYMGLVTDPTNPVSKELSAYAELSIYYIGFNATVPPFDDVKIRQAFTYAVDKERLITLAAYDTVSPSYGILPPDMPGYNSSLQGLKFDPIKAKELIVESKYGDVSKLPTIVVTTSGWGNNITGVLGGIIEEWRRNLGVEVTVRQLEPENYLYSLNQEKNQMFEFGWIADYPDPQDFIDVLFRTGEQNNIGGYNNSQLDSILDRAAVEQDNTTRLSMYQQAEQIVVQDAAVLPISFGHNYVLVKPYVSGYKLSPLGFSFLNQVSVRK